MAKDRDNRGISFLALACSCFALSGSAIAPASAQTTYTETTLKNFASIAPHGAYPFAGVVLDEAGNMFGTTSSGGDASRGVVYKIAPSGKETVRYNFTDGADGGIPEGAIVLDAEGNIYGTTEYGGTAGRGLVYKIDPDGKETILHNFTDFPDGAYPLAGLIRDKAGNFYGTTGDGGAAGYGTVFKLDPAGNETILYSFTGGADGGGPAAGVVLDAAGNLYGTTVSGGADVRPCAYPPIGCGVVYKLDPSGKETVLHAFTESPDGAESYAGVILDAEGNIYGTTLVGGSSQCDCGVVFRLDAQGHETILHTFTGGTDGANPESALTLDRRGDLYGTAYTGGAGGNGVVYKLDSTGQQTILHNFTASTQEGGGPVSAVTLDAAGNLYGTTAGGGLTGNGTVYKLDPARRETVFNIFPGGVEGNSPKGSVIRDAAGNLYGDTYLGGLKGLGLVYKIDTAGRETVLYNFPGVASGMYPWGNLTQDAAGNLYGIADADSTLPVLYKISSPGHERVLATFPVYSNPQTPVTIDRAGNIYGAVIEDGIPNCVYACGIVYKLSAAGQFTTLYQFTGGSDGYNPNGGLILDARGNLYGTTGVGGASDFGVVYKLDPAGDQTVLYAFTGGADGGSPQSGVVADAAGNLYGVTLLGGANGAGVVFKLDSSGNETVLYNNEYTSSGVTLDAGGNIFGVIDGSGVAGCGGVFRLTAAGQYTTLYSFPCGAGGEDPGPSVVLDAEGNIYGTTEFGGANNGGIVFKLSPPSGSDTTRP